MKKLLFTLLSLMLILMAAGCGAEKMGEGSFKILDQYTLMQSGEEIYDLLAGESIVGGVRVFAIGDVQVPENSGSPMQYLIGALDIIDMESCDHYMLGSCLYADWQLTCGQGQQSYVHYFYLTEDFVYDLWMDSSCVAQPEETEIARFYRDTIRNPSKTG